MLEEQLLDTPRHQRCTPTNIHTKSHAGSTRFWVAFRARWKRKALNMNHMWHLHGSSSIKCVEKTKHNTFSMNYSLGERCSAVAYEGMLVVFISYKIKSS